MSSHTTVPDIYGPGTYTDTSFIPLTQDCPRLLQWLACETPGFTTDSQLLKSINWKGNDLPLLPGPLKAQALAAVLHAMAGIVGKEISASKDVDTGKISIDIDHAGMYPASASIVMINGKSPTEMIQDGTFFKLGTDLDKGALDKNPWHLRSWSIYPTKDPKVWYQIMSNLNAKGYLQAFGLDSEAPVKDNDEAYNAMKAVFSTYSAPELEHKHMVHGFCGQTCYTPQQWRETLMGKRLAAHPLINYARERETPDLPPVPFPRIPGDSRPLAGIKVVELARVIAAPALGACLSSFGAEVVKAESPNLPDPNPLQLTLTAGKYTCPLDLNKDQDRAKLHELLQDADVVVQAFRRGSLERKGFGLNDMLEMANKRGKGIVYLDLSCYGPDGTYSERPGYQQIADAASGACYVFGKAYGFDEGVAVLPSLPIADMLGGLTGAIAVMLALRDRARHGGSYHCDTALTSVDTIQLVEEVGCYPPEVVKKIQDTYEFGPQTPDLHVEELLFVVADAWQKKTDLLKRKEYYAHFPESPFGKDHTILGPVVRYDNSGVSPYWKHSPVPYLHHKNVQWAH